VGGQPTSIPSVAVLGHYWAVAWMETEQQSVSLTLCNISNSTHTATTCPRSTKSSGAGDARRLMLNLLADFCERRAECGGVRAAMAGVARVGGG